MNNVSRNIDSGTNKSIIPGAYKIKLVELFNHAGESLEIQNVITKITITESIYSNTLICKANVRDTTNLVEDFPLIGQERVRIKFERRGEDGTDKELDLEFYITEYPLYGRGREKHVQVFSFTGISKHAYISRFKKISRAVEGLTSDEISNIITKDLGSDKFVLNNPPISRFKGTINTQTPLDAAEWLRKKTFDDKQAPYYLYQTLNGDINLSSHTELVEQEKYLDYYSSRDFNHQPNTEEDYLERKHRILEITSDLKLGKIFQAIDGAYASENFYLDIGNKTFTSTEFSHSIEGNSLGKKPPFSSSFLIEDEVINNKFQSHHEYISTNAFAFDTADKNYNEMKKESGGITKAFIENLETITHDLKLFGDFDLNAGKVIDINLPRAVEPAIQRDVVSDTQNGYIDEHLSGKYLITSSIHTFENGEYFTQVKIKRDSFTIDL
jgi:hypothetical protein